MLKFESAVKYHRGLIFSLLQRSFANLWNGPLEKKIKQYDQDLFDNLDTVGACVLITCIYDLAIGMASWDPRQGPQKVILGYNCILPEFQNRGCGVAQIKEVLRRLNTAGFKNAVVTTGRHPFFVPAAKMYLACGFREIHRNNNGEDPANDTIDYEIEL